MFPKLKNCVEYPSEPAAAGLVEASFRLEGARSQNRTYLISLLLPWLENIELVDPTIGEDSCEGPRGWGSEEATQLLLK
ncbi:Sax-2p [Parelaphostrongylus tenuis]|uniref:Sax-2p n=1 Tax=Parelaphostrongylus tenuis TaxID=148309 RepID=A0AAD5R7N0_PARTN|nr:Sax-2p [Parelaphostrongylus tenuis]